MTDPMFDIALKIVLDKIADNPTRLNQLSHDVLRKLILCVGELDKYVVVHNQRCLVSEVIKALNRVCAVDSNIGPSLQKCSQCEFVEIYTDYYDDLSYCENSASGCMQIICPECYNKNDGCCNECYALLSHE